MSEQAKVWVCESSGRTEIHVFNDERAAERIAHQAREHGHRAEVWQM